MITFRSWLQAPALPHVMCMHESYLFPTVPLYNAEAASWQHARVVRPAGVRFTDLNMGAPLLTSFGRRYNLDYSHTYTIKYNYLSNIY